MPEKFRPPSDDARATEAPTIEAPTIEDVAAPPAGLFREATSALTGPERRAFLHRFKEEHPEVFLGELSSGEAGAPPEDPPGQFSEEEWWEALIRQLKKEANRFMAATTNL